MFKKLLIGILILFILVLLGLGGLYYTGNLELITASGGLIIATPTSITIDLETTPDDSTPEELAPTSTMTPIPPPSPTANDETSNNEVSSPLTETVTITSTQTITATQSTAIVTPTIIITSTVVITAEVPSSIISPTVTSTVAATGIAVAEAATTTPTATPLRQPTATQPPQPTTNNIPAGLIPTPTTGNMSGDWDFNFGQMSLRQSGVSVSGDYHWYGDGDKGRITGSFIYNTNQFKGLWVSQNPVVQGFLDWRLANDRAFTGSFENNRLTGQWCGVRTGDPLPAGCGFSGDWNLHFGSGNLAGRANLIQTGSTVTGSYSADDGRSGTIEGIITVIDITEAILRGTWREANGGSNQFEWRLNQLTNRSFEGRRQEGNSEWCGWRDGQEKPDTCGF